MSVIMTLRVEADGAAVEKLAADEPSTFADVVVKAKELGVISHHFYASEREVMVIDEWPNPQAFQTFFDDNGPEIQRIMSTIGVTSEPVITFWHKLETGDDVG